MHCKFYVTILDVQEQEIAIIEEEEWSINSKKLLLMLFFRTVPLSICI